MTYDQALADAKSKHDTYAAAYRAYRNSGIKDVETEVYLNHVQAEVSAAYDLAQKILDDYESERWAGGDSL